MLRQDLSPDPRSQEGSRVAELEKRLQILEQELCALKRAVDFGSTRGSGLSGSQWLSLGSEASDSDIDRISDITEHMEWPEEEPEVSPMASMAAFHEDFAPEIVHTKKKPTAEPLVAGTEDSDQNDQLVAERKLFWLQLIRDHTSLKSHKKLGIGAWLLSAAGPRMFLAFFRG